MATAAISVEQALDRTEWRHLANWALCWIILPVLPFIPFWFVGGPPRYLDIIATGVVGLILRRQRYAIRLTAFFALLFYGTLYAISALFNLRIDSLFHAIRFLMELDPLASPEYLTAAALFALNIGIACVALRLPGNFTSSGPLFAAAGLVLAVAAIDIWSSLASQGSYKRTAPHDAAFSSGAHQANLASLADGKTNVMVVMVESMGLSHDPALRRQFLNLWSDPRIMARYRVRSGSSPFFGSTTSGELRELCGRWGDYGEIDALDAACLPARLAKAGYRTSAYHSFTGTMFDRVRWYPHIGFQKQIFGPELIARGSSRCAGIFPGACDRDVPAIIGEDMRRATGPQFTYWLTVNSHLPVISEPGMVRRDCDALGLEAHADLPMVCRLFSIWADIAGSLVNMVSDPGFPPTHVLIVGDHMPPFLDRKSRQLFDAGQVPWILLEHRGNRTAG